MTNQQRYENLGKFLAAAKPPSAIADYLRKNFDREDHERDLVGRYLAVTAIYYAANDEHHIDQCEWECHDDLESVQTVVEGHVFAEVRADYDHEALVIDLDTGTEVGFTITEEVMFDSPVDSVPFEVTIYAKYEHLISELVVGLEVALRELERLSSIYGSYPGSKNGEVDSAELNIVATALGMTKEDR